MRNPNRNRRGFTLVELMVVITILGLITGIAVYSLMEAGVAAKWKTTCLQAKTLAVAVNRFYLDCNRYPEQSEGLDVLINRPSDPKTSKRWSGPYLESVDKVPQDAWGNAYIYKIPGSNSQKFEIISYGEDGVEGQRDSNNKWDRDIYNWKNYENEEK